MIELGISIIILGICCYFDLKSKSIPNVIFLVVALVTLADLIMQAVTGDISDIIINKVTGMLPGILLLILSRVTKEKVGQGDGTLLIILGFLMSFHDTVIILCIGLFLQSLLASFLLIIKRVDKQTQIPFVPFLLVGNIIVFLYGNHV